jgi:hypothetical protein
MEKEIYVVQFDNGFDRRSTTTLQPDPVFAAMFGQRHAPDAFAQRWNSVADQRRWKIVVRDKNGHVLHEEPVVFRLHFDAASTH